MGHIQHERLPKSKMASSDNDRFTFEIVHVLHFRNALNEELCCKSSAITRSLAKVWLEILVAHLATNFQDLVTKVKNLVALAPVLSAILRPGMLLFLSVIANIDVLCHIFCCFHSRGCSFYSQLKRAVEPRKIFIMPSHYKKIMPAQQPIGARVLL